MTSDLTLLALAIMLGVLHIVLASRSQLAARVSMGC